MSKNPTPKRAGPASGAREERLKEALKANLQRRKAQARARQDDNKPDTADKAG